MPATLELVPTKEQRQSAFRLGLLIDAPKPEGKGTRSPVVWYWSVANHPRSWLGSWCLGTTWWWTYRPVERDTFRGQSDEFGVVLGTFARARRRWLDEHGFQSEE